MPHKILEAEARIRNDMRGVPTIRPTPEGVVTVGGVNDDSLKRFSTPERIALFFRDEYSGCLPDRAAVILANVEAASRRGELTPEQRGAWLEGIAAMDRDITPTSDGSVALSDMVHQRAVDRARMLVRSNPGSTARHGSPSTPPRADWRSVDQGQLLNGVVLDPLG